MVCKSCPKSKSDAWGPEAVYHSALDRHFADLSLWLWPFLLSLVADFFLFMEHLYLDVLPSPKSKHGGERNSLSLLSPSILLPLLPGLLGREPGLHRLFPAAISSKPVLLLQTFMQRFPLLHLNSCLLGLVSATPGLSLQVPLLTQSVFVFVHGHYKDSKYFHSNAIWGERQNHFLILLQ